MRWASSASARRLDQRRGSRSRWGAGAGPGSGRAAGWLWRPITTGTARPIWPAPVADLDDGQVERVEDHSTFRPTRAGSTS